MRLELLRSRPGEMDLLRRLAFVLAADGQRAAALQYAARSCELAPDDPRAWSDRGCVHALLGELRDAVAQYSKAIALDRDFAVGWHNLGVALAHLGDSRGAFTALRNAQLLDGRADTCIALGKLLVESGLVDAALATFDRAERLERSALPATG